MISVRCATCGARLEKCASHVNRSRREHGPDAKFFCNRVCFGASRRDPNPPTRAEKRAAKAAYDSNYRKVNARKLKTNKATWYRTTFDPQKGKLQREKRKLRLGPDHHTRYCRAYFAADPRRKRAKVRYDERRRDADYGDYAECHRLLVKLESAIRKAQPWYERAKARGYYERTSNQRKRDAQINRH